MLPRDIVERYCIRKGGDFRIADTDPADTSGLDIDKNEAKTLLATGAKRLAELQERLYADRRWGILIILQGLDASGKDSAIKHVLSGINPQGCEVHSFAAPSRQELAHDFMWRTTVALPARGRIGVFNRSYYEETLIVRVHPDLLARERLPDSLVGDDIWTQRFEDIRGFERYLGRNGILPLKFFLHVSKEEQARRLMARIDDPEKHWKFDPADTAERKLWDRYMHAYEETIRHTATQDAPWYVVPADHKWFTRTVVAATIAERMQALDLRFPEPTPAEHAEMALARKVLTAELPAQSKNKPPAKKP